MCVYVYVCVQDQDRKHSERTERTGRQRHRMRETGRTNEIETMEAHTETKGMFTLVVETFSALHGFFVRPSRRTHLSLRFNDRTLNLRITFFVI